MKITFEGTIDEVRKQVQEFSYAFSAGVAFAADNKPGEFPPFAEGVAKRSTEKDQADAHTQETGEKPKRTSRRRKKKEEAPVGEEKPKRTSRRKKAKPVEEAVVEDQISDADVAKAASNAAPVITPKAVKAILEEYGAGSVNDLNQEQRREFIDQLNEAVEDAK